MDNEKINILEKIKRELLVLPFLDSDERKIDYIEMNNWLKKVIEFYRVCGIKLTYDDFNNIFSEDSTNYKKVNHIVNTYMKVFFENINNIEADLFRKTIFELDVDVEHHVMEEIYSAVSIINNKNRNVFDKIFDTINRDIDGLEIDKLNFHNVVSVRKKIDKMLIELKNADIKEINNREDITRFLNLITNGDFKKYDSSKKKAIVSVANEIIDRIILLRLFNSVHDKYIKYSKDNDYNNVLKQIISGEIKVSELEEELEIDNTLYLFLKKKDVKGKELKNKEIQILNLQKMIALYNKKISKLKKDYVNGFNNEYDIKTVLENLDIRTDYDDEKLFGIFEIKKLPPDSMILNEMPLFMQNGIIIPDVNSKEFDELSEIALHFAKKRKDNSVNNKKRR